MRRLLAGILVLGLGSSASAHPGRLDAQGCHAVHERWQAGDGAVFERGTYHCHRVLDTLRLGERDILQEDRARPGRPHPIPRPNPEGP